MLKIEMPEKVKKIIGILTDAGYEAYAVGGCVRDSVLGRTPKDWDITTNASPKEVKGLFRKTVDTGIEHGTVTVLLDREGFEVTTYRIDGKYEDGRHPSEVTFTRNLKEDLLRRDFTINAMAYNDTDGLVDLFNGMSDLEKGIIRAVGNPRERFSEDALRIMRAVRFASELGFDIEEETFNAMRQLVQGLKSISAERIRIELQKLIMGAYPEKIKLAERAGITAVVFPEWDRAAATEQENPHHIYNVADHTLVSIKAIQRLAGINETEDAAEKAVRDRNEDGLKKYGNGVKKAKGGIGINGNAHPKIEKSLKKIKLDEEFTPKEKQILCLTMLLHDIGKPQTKLMKGKVAHFYGHQKLSAVMAEEILKRLKYDNETVETVRKLVRHHDDRFKMTWDMSSSDARKLASRIGLNNLRLLIPVQYADALAQSPDCIDASIARILDMKRLCERIVSEHQCVTVKDLAIKGSDLTDMGVKQGPEIGRLLKLLLDEVIEKPERNNREYLIERAEREIYR